METFYLSHPHDLHEADLPASVMALGFFDGLHKGHQKVINTAKAQADQQGLRLSAMTFDPNPALVLGFKDTPDYLTPLAQKEALFASLGVDILFVVQFDKQFSSLTPAQFVSDYVTRLAVKHAVAGFDFTYGFKGKGTMADMASLATEALETTIVEKEMMHEEKISSTGIRQLIAKGAVADVPTYMGRFFEMNGRVVTGEKRGRDIGFPTANISNDQGYQMPASGVYVVTLQVGEHWYKGVASVGAKPTFYEDGTVPVELEVYLLDVTLDIYDQMVSVVFYEKLRDQVAFASVAALTEQMKQDEQQTRQYFQTHVISE